MPERVSKQIPWFVCRAHSSEFILEYISLYLTPASLHSPHSPAPATPRTGPSAPPRAARRAPAPRSLEQICLGLQRRALPLLVAPVLVRLRSARRPLRLAPFTHPGGSAPGEREHRAREMRSKRDAPKEPNGPTAHQPTSPSHSAAPPRLGSSRPRSLRARARAGRARGTGGGTRRVRLVREKGRGVSSQYGREGGGAGRAPGQRAGGRPSPRARTRGPRAPRAAPRRARTPCRRVALRGGTRRVRLVRGGGRGVSG